MTRFGIALPSGGSSSPPLTASAIAAAAREIEAAGFTSAWAFDSIGRARMLSSHASSASRPIRRERPRRPDASSRVRRGPIPRSSNTRTGMLTPFTA